MGDGRGTTYAKANEFARGADRGLHRQVRRAEREADSRGARRYAEAISDGDGDRVRQLQLLRHRLFADGAPLRSHLLDRRGGERSWTRVLARVDREGSGGASSRRWETQSLSALEERRNSFRTGGRRAYAGGGGAVESSVPGDGTRSDDHQVDLVEAAAETARVNR